MHKPTDDEIESAEARLTQARRDLVAGTATTKAALRDSLVKPTTLLAIAVVAGVAGYLMFRPRPVRYGRPAYSQQTKQSATTLLGLVAAIAARYGMQRLPAVGYHLFERAMQKRGAFSRAPPRSGVTLH